VRFIVYGAGAVGGVVGGRMFQHGHDVVLVARGANLDRLREVGLRLESPDGPVTLPIPAIGHPGELELAADDVVLLCVKSQDTGHALDTLAAIVPAELPIVCVQNGVANEHAALRRFPNVYGVCVVCPALHLEPGVVEASESPVTGILDVGRYPHGVDPLGDALAGAFAESTFAAVARPDIMRWKHGKLLNNLSNAIDALCGSGDGVQELRSRARREGIACLEAAGIEYVSADEDAARRGASFEWGGAASRSRLGSSSWQSLVRGTGSIEADYLNGEVVLLGRVHGVPTPVNALLQTLAARAARERWTPRSMDPESVIRLLPGTRDF